MCPDYKHGQMKRMYISDFLFYFKAFFAQHTERFSHNMKIMKVNPILGQFTT